MQPGATRGEEVSPAGPTPPSAPSSQSPAEYLADDDVDVLRWPRDDQLRAVAAAAGRACLLVLDDDVQPPPVWGRLEDWVREPIDTAELRARRELLCRRAIACRPVTLDDDCLLHRGSTWIALPSLEAAILRPLLEHIGHLVSRRALITQIEAPEGDPGRTLDATMQRLRRRVRPMGVTIHTIRAAGFLLELVDPPD